MLYAPDKFARVKSITGVTAVDATADSIACTDDNITLICVSGNLWFNPIGTAVAAATSIKLTGGQSLDLNVFSVLSLISDASGATYQIIKWVI